MAHLLERTSRSNAEAAKDAKENCVYWFVPVNPTVGTVLNGFDPSFFQAS